MLLYETVYQCWQPIWFVTYLRSQFKRVNIVTAFCNNLTLPVLIHLNIISVT